MRYTTATFWKIESIWNLMAHGDAREGKWRGNWRMEWIASTLHTTSEHDVSSITTADAHTSAASSRLNWRPRWFKWTRPFRRKTKSGFCACAITFQTQSTPLVATKAPILCDNLPSLTVEALRLSAVCVNPWMNTTVGSMALMWEFVRDASSLR